MNESSWVAVSFSSYILVFLFGVVWLALWMRRRSTSRPPVDFQLLRGAGETLRRKVAGFHEDFLFQVAGASLVPPVVAVIVLVVIGLVFRPESRLAVSLELLVPAAIFFGATVLMVGILMGKVQAYKNCTLGYLGERAVGEAMEPLLAAGYRVFHDVPMTKGCIPFNIDHVAVGSNGVFAIETKTRSKGPARAGYDDYRMAYDGRRLIWPWGEDASVPQQAEGRAAAFSRWLNSQTGLGIEARPVLVVPGWFVDRQGVGKLLVVNHRQLASAVKQGGDRALKPEQIDLLARQLDTLCRDVRD